MTIDAIRATDPRYDLNDVDSGPSRATANTQAPQPSAEQRQARFIESEHGSTHYPPELFADSSSPATTTTDTVAPAAGRPGQSDAFHAMAADAGMSTKPTADAEKTTPATAGGVTSGNLYTTSPNEMAVTQTKLPTKETVALIRKHWPELTERGARTLAAQWAMETGFGKSCYSNNFGNVKATSDKVGHMYLKNIWEFPTPRTMAAAEKMVAASGGMAKLASADFKAKKGYPADAPIVVFSPPHPQTRFVAFKTADEGMAAYVRFKQGIAAKHPDYVAALNRGDVRGVAAVLAKVHYATAPDAAYAAGMARAAKTIDSELGPAS